MERTRKPSAAEERLADIHARLESANAFVRALDVPAELAPAFMTSRPELIRLATPRPLDEGECRVLFALVGGLLETNAVLREHAEAVADGAREYRAALLGAIATADRLGRLARWQTVDEPEDEEVEAGAPR